MSVLLGALAGSVGGYVGAELHSAGIGSVRPSAGTSTTAANLASVAFQDVPAVIAGLRESVVSIDALIETVNRGGSITATQHSGTGTVLRPEGLIATNAHVVAGATSIGVRLPDGQIVAGTVVALDVVQDLAVVHVDRTDLRPPPFGDSTGLVVGDVVIALGNALALRGGPTATIGIVSALDRTVTTGPKAELLHLIQTDAAINVGDSGGPLINARGAVVGINTATTGQSIGFAIPIDRALPILAALLEGGA